MIIIDWSAMWLGLGIGAVVSVLFFAGLGWGMGVALRTNRPLAVLGLSAVLRIAALLAVGWTVTAGIGAFGLAGFGVAFLMARTVVILGARLPRGGGWTS